MLGVIGYIWVAVSQAKNGQKLRTHFVQDSQILPVRQSDKMRHSVLLLFFSLANSYHVLFVHNMGTKSHLITMKPIIEETLARGHKVTSIFFNTIQLNHENYTEIVIPSVIDKMYDVGSKKLMEKGGNNIFNPKLWLWAYNMYQEYMDKIALDVFSPEPVKELIKNKPKIDVVVSMIPNMAIFAEIFDCPLITFMPAGPVSFMMKGTTNVINHSVQPSLLAPLIEPMSFMDRLKNHALVNFVDLYMIWWTGFMFSFQKDFLKSELGLDVNDPDTILTERLAIYLSHSHPITHGAWQYLPNIIEVRKK